MIFIKIIYIHVYNVNKQDPPSSRLSPQRHHPMQKMSGSPFPKHQGRGGLTMD